MECLLLLLSMKQCHGFKDQPAGHCATSLLSYRRDRRQLLMVSNRAAMVRAGLGLAWYRLQMSFPGGNLFRSLAGFKAVCSLQNLWEKTMKILLFGISIRESVLQLNQWLLDWWRKWDANPFQRGGKGICPWVLMSQFCARSRKANKWKRTCIII